MLICLGNWQRPGIDFVETFSSVAPKSICGQSDQNHAGCVKRVLRYLAGTLDYEIVYKRAQSTQHPKIVIQGYCDSDWASDAADRKSYEGFVVVLAGGAKSWSSKRQPIIVLSTAEAEYVAACEATMERLKS
ncbi:hypothetical protein KXD40_004665 [Peronospora effusa]|nr:hypothetical protein KXD40_004665 [Peronospora effusa]